MASLNILTLEEIAAREQNPPRGRTGRRRSAERRGHGVDEQVDMRSVNGIIKRGIINALAVVFIHRQ